MAQLGVMSFLISLVVLQSVAHPLFPAGNHTRTLAPRQCVYNTATNIWDCDDNMATVDQMIERMRNPAEGGKAIDRNSVVFWSELGDMVNAPTGPAMWISVWTRKAKVKSYWFRDATSGKGDDGWFSKNMAWARERADIPVYTERYGGSTWELFSFCWYQAMSLAAINPDAYVFTRKEVTTFNPASVWSRIELPYLTKNPRIERIWRVDPRPPDEGGTSCQLSERELTWDRSRGDKEIEPSFDCPAKSAPAPAQPSAGGLLLRTDMTATYRPY